MLGEVFLLGGGGGGSPGRSFGEVWTEVIGEVFRLALLGFSEQIKTSAQSSICTAKSVKVQGHFS